MKTQDLKSTLLPTEKKTFPAMVEQFKGEIAKALPKHLNADRMARIALTEFRKNKELANCDPKSVFASIIVAAQLGLEPGLLGQGYLVPYRSECQFIPGWQGLYELVTRSGRASVETQCVYEGDEFDYMLGTKSFIMHRPRGEDDPTKITHVYAIGRINGIDNPVHEIWTVDKISKHRDRNNKQGSRHYSYKHFEMYARKVVLLQVIKYMPKSIELSRAISLEHSAGKSVQNIAIKEAIDGSYSVESEPVIEEKPETSLMTEESDEEITARINQLME